MQKDEQRYARIAQLAAQRDEQERSLVSLEATLRRLIYDVDTDEDE
jgi:hypothetical protein